MTIEPRKFQQRAIKRARNITPDDRHTFAYVVPGGGKSIMASLFAQTLLEDNVIDGVLWVVPRSPLRDQAVDDFHEVLGSKHLRTASNVHWVLKEKSDVGVVTTYHAVDSAQMYEGSDSFTRFCKMNRVLLIIDEWHHLADVEGGAAWTESLRPLIEEHAAHVLFMTGSRERGDRTPIPWMPKADGELPDGGFHIYYSRTDAIAEHAILSHSIRFFDGEGAFLEGGDRRVYTLSEEGVEDDARKTLRMAVTGRYAQEFLSESVRLLHNYRRRNNNIGRMLVVCPSIHLMEKWRDSPDLWGGLRVTAVHAKDSKSHAEIRSFRKGQGDVLMTIGMAHEGFSCKDVGVVVYLSKAWTRTMVEQSWDRANRMLTGKKESLILCPKIPFLESLAAEIHEDQERGEELAEKQRMEREVGDREDGPQDIPLDSTMTDQTGFLMDEHGEVDSDTLAQIDILLTEADVSHGKAVEVLQKLEQVRSYGAPAAVAERPNEEVERELRAELKSITNRVDRSTGVAPGTTNLRLVRLFGKKRAMMTIADLKEAKKVSLSWLG